MNEYHVYYSLMQHSHSSQQPSNISPDDIAIYAHVMLTREGTLDEIAIAKRVQDAYPNDPNVRAIYDQIRQLMDPVFSPHDYPSMN